MATHGHRFRGLPSEAEPASASWLGLNDLPDPSVHLVSPASPSQASSIVFLLVYLFISAVLDLHFCAWAFSSYASGADS